MFQKSYSLNSVFFSNYILYVSFLGHIRKKLIEKSPKGHALNIKEQVKFGNISLKQKLGYYSFYYAIRKKYKNIFEIAKEIDANPIIIIIIIANKIIN